MKAIALFPILLAITLIAISIYGLVLGFQASILVGIIILLVEPAPLVVGLVALLANIDLAQKLADFIFG